MKMTKRIIALMMAVALLAAILVGCSSNNNNTNGSSDADSNSDSSASSAASGDDSENTIQGTGDSNVPLSMTLFDVEYTVGVSKIKDLNDNEWGYDADSWSDVDMDEKLELGKYNSNASYKKMDNNTTEITVSFENLDEPFATPANCNITDLSFEGTPDGTIKKAGVKILGGKVDLTTCSTPDDLDKALGSVLSSYTKETTDYSSFTVVDYKFDLKDGSVDIYTQVDNDSKAFSKIKADLRYSEDTSEDENETGEKASSVSTGMSESMNGFTALATSGDSDKLAPSITLFDKVYTVGKTTLKDLVDDGWGYDTDDWGEVDMEKEVKYKTGYNNKKMHNNTAEIEVSIGNYTAKFAKPEDCIVTGISIDGTIDGVISKAGVKLCGDIDLTECKTTPDLEDKIEKAASWAEKKEYSESVYDYHFLANDGNGSIVMYVTLDDDSKIKNYKVELKITDDYTYKEPAKD